ncbi:MAG: membrane protein insertase YidC [candidate division KSB1 bacterium]|nr:membrane protein insertase YidC [candidate division KSB1 bacterium]MDZ7301956.1 membrane protein insertase YidC [candidate division KSB1 bacterium]MDZ7312361.1 membrane protein insertase YidC [candidate division KSB1 bacterium]
MEFDRKTILAFLLIGLILIIVNTDFYRQLMLGDLPQKKLPDSSSVTTSDSVRKPERTGNFRFDRSRIQEDSSSPMPVDEKIDLLKERNQEKEIHIESPLYSGTVSTMGASIKSWQFKKYSGPNGGPVSLVNDGENNLVVQLPIAGDTLNTGVLNFSLEYPAAQIGDSIYLAPGQTLELVFTREVLPEKFLRKTLLFSGDEYTIRLKVELNNLSDIILGYSYLLSWHTGLASTEERVAEDMGYAKAYSLANKELDEFDVGSKITASRVNDDWPAMWAAIRTKYFAVAVIPQEVTAKGVRFVGHTSKMENQIVHKAYQMNLAMPVSHEGSSIQEFIVYIGPLDYKIVKGLGVELERIMNFGWRIIQPISILVLWTFTFLHKFISNYGIVLIIFSLLVKVVLHPLTRKSYQSMKEMQALQPAMTALREKYANDPQRMNAEIMKLYKEHGVNPLGGCLPMLLQMPLLYALFIVFRSTIELRQAKFVWWIKDLSAPDTIFTLPFSLPLYGNSVNVLPLVMGATMLIQQVMTMKDPKQKMMVYMMPIIFTLAFNSFPSGLNLYYTLFNVFSILQQQYMTTAPTEKKAPKKKAYKKFVADWRKHGVNALFSRKRLK